VAALQATLLRLENEGIAAIEIDPPHRLALVALLSNAALEDVVVALVAGVSGLRLREVEELAQPDEEELVIGAFLPALAVLPFGNEGFYGGGAGVVRQGLRPREGRP
jgi:hypothetical protein